MPISRYWRQAYTQDRLIHKTGLYDMYPSETRLVCTQQSPPPSTPDFTQSSHTGTNARTCTVELGLLILLQSYPCKRRFPVRFRVLTGLTHATLRADCGSCVLARLMHATGLCATGGCRIQASTRDRLVHKSGLCTRHYGMCFANGIWIDSCLCIAIGIQLHCQHQGGV